MSTKKIGVWGLGVVGTAALNYLLRQGYTVGVMDRRDLGAHEIEQLNKRGVRFYPEREKEQFFADHEQVLPSPGIDLRPYAAHAHQWISELDLVQEHCTAPIIAVTGTLGKTTTTSLIAHVLRYAGKRVWVGGNIGVGVLDLLSDTTSYDFILIEVSSFQLALTKSFAPHIAVWTNFYPNHLDRHGSEAEYFTAKSQIFAHQKPGGIAIYPSTLRPDSIPAGVSVWKLSEVVNIDLPLVTYPENIICAQAVVESVGITSEQFRSALPSFEREEHRLEFVAELGGICIYNDSKSTVPEATLAAVQHIGKPIILMLGGISKGVDRKPMFSKLRERVKHIICFGAEAEQLHQYAMEHNIPSSAYQDLAPAVAAALTCAQSGDGILFSPAGASFDLFKDYKERGTQFKDLLKRKHHEKSSDTHHSRAGQRTDNSSI